MSASKFKQLLIELNGPGVYSAIAKYVWIYFSILMYKFTSPFPSTNFNLLLLSHVWIYFSSPLYEFTFPLHV